VTESPSSEPLLSEMLKVHLPFVTGFLKTSDGFCNLEAEDLDKIAGICTIVSFTPEQYLMRRGEMGDIMYVLTEGQVRVVIPDDSGGDPSTLLLGTGDIVGEMALLTDGKRRADVIACTDVSALAMHKKHVFRLLYRHPPLASFLTRILVKRIQSIDGFRQIGKYRLLGELGLGCTARVYEGIHVHLERPVAIKMLNHALMYDDLFRERFQSEARIIAKLQHPNVIQVYDTEHSHGTLFIVMEKLLGRDLKKQLQQISRFSPEKVVPILRQVCEALLYAHQEGILHRDVKLANCFMTEDGQIKLMDFGLSRPLGTQERMSVEGSPDYLAPEVIRGKTPDERSDIYALGIMAFALLTGILPFNAKNVREVLVNQIQKPIPDIREFVPAIPGNLIDFIQGTLVKDPDQRLSDWPTIFSLLNLRKRSKVGPGATRATGHQSIVLTCPETSVPALQEALRELSTKIEGLTWSDPRS